MRHGWLVVAAVMWAPAFRAAADWQPGIEWGSTDNRSLFVRLIASGPRSFDLGETGAWSWRVTPEIDLGRWFHDFDDHDLWEAGVTPVLEAQRPIEGGVLGFIWGSALTCFPIPDSMGTDWAQPSSLAIMWESTGNLRECVGPLAIVSSTFPMAG